MEIITLVFFAILGAIIGSFLNVVILRHNTGRGLQGRSGCFTCDRNLKWFELIPVVSYLIQKGKCRSCESTISAQYPIIEGATAIVFALVSWKLLAPFYVVYSLVDIFLLLITLFIFSILVVIFVYDLYHKIIPDKFSLMFSIAAFLSLVFTHQSALLSFPYYLDLIAGPLFALPFYILWKVSGGRWIGLGDAKLVIGIGWFLGFSSGLSALALAFWIGAVVSLVLMYAPQILPKKHRFTWKSEVPFGPFLIFATLVIFLIYFDFFGINTFLYFLV